MNEGEINDIADANYDDDLYETRDARLFALLVDVAVAYVRELQASPSTAASLGSLSGMNEIDIAIAGLRENLDLRFEGNN